MKDKRRLPVRNAKIYILFCSSILMYFACFVRADIIDEVLKKRPGSSPERVEYVRKLIEDNSDHPRILELRLCHLNQLLVTSKEPSHFQNLIKQLERLSEDASQNNVLNFKCKMLIGEILFDYLKQRKAAFQYYKNLENHPALSGNDLVTDYRRVNLYCYITKSGIIPPVRELKEVEKYSRLVMAYPYLGMEDRKMYRKFYECYEEAGKHFIMAVSRDLEKLNSVDIYPSHSSLIDQRERAIARIIGVNVMKKEVEEIVKTEHLDRKVQIDPGAIVDQSISQPNDIVETNDVNVTLMTDADLPEQERNWLYPLLGGLLIAATVIVLIQKRKK